MRCCVCCHVDLRGGYSPVESQRAFFVGLIANDGQGRVMLELVAECPSA